LSTHKLARAGVAALAFVLVAGLAGPGCPWFKMMKYQQARDGFSFDTDDYDAEGPKAQTMRLPVAGTVSIDGGDFPVTLIDADQFVSNPLRGDALSVERGKQLFVTFCTPCHGADGLTRGFVGARFPFVRSLITAQARGYTDAYLFAMIRNGRGLMPRYGARVSVDERWDLVNYVRNLQATSPVAPPGAGLTSIPPGLPPSASAPAAPAPAVPK
jgi:mono/diheme cytochrome c family protein